MSSRCDLREPVTFWSLDEIPGLRKKHQNELGLLEGALWAPVSSECFCRVKAALRPACLCLCPDVCAQGRLDGAGQPKLVGAGDKGQGTALCTAGGWNWVGFEVRSNLSHSVVLRGLLASSLRLAPLFSAPRLSLRPSL